MDIQWWRSRSKLDIFTNRTFMFFFLLRQVVSVKTILLWCFCLPMMMLMMELINSS